MPLRDKELGCGWTINEVVHGNLDAVMVFFRLRVKAGPPRLELLHLQQMLSHPFGLPNVLPAVARQTRNVR